MNAQPLHRLSRDFNQQTCSSTEGWGEKYRTHTVGYSCISIENDFGSSEILQQFFLLQPCVLSPDLFNLYNDAILRELEIQDSLLSA